LSEEKARKLIQKLSEDFGVEPPRVVVDDRLVDERCDERAYACYNFEKKEILLRKTWGLRNLLHEFCHHLQYILAKENPWLAYPDIMVGGPHCQRSYEKEAKIFANIYGRFYRDDQE